jgi:hypothetical protein
MKLKRPLTGDFDPATRILKISGGNSVGKQSAVEVPVEDVNVFIGWIVAVLFEKYSQPGGATKTLVATEMSIALHPDDKGSNSVVFGFKAGDFQLGFSVPVHTTAPEKLASIKAHLLQALAEMQDSGTPTRQ